MATRESEDLVVLAIALLALVLTTCVWASQTATTLRPPVDLADPANIQAGRQMFNVTWTHYCHGKDARAGGMRGPSFRNGGFNTCMPPSKAPRPR
jgi:hypothetical protein